jgi:flagellar basal body-associated protein FliL
MQPAGYSKEGYGFRRVVLLLLMIMMVVVVLVIMMMMMMMNSDYILCQNYDVRKSTEEISGPRKFV